MEYHLPPPPPPPPPDLVGIALLRRRSEKLLQWKLIIQFEVTENSRSNINPERQWSKLLEYRGLHDLVRRRLQATRPADLVWEMFVSSVFVSFAPPAVDGRYWEEERTKSTRTNGIMEWLIKC